MSFLAQAAAAISIVAVVPWVLWRSAEDANARAWGRYWVVVAVVGAISLLLPRGGLALGPAVFYLAGSAALALSVPARLLRGFPLPVTEPAVIGALLNPLVGAGLLLIDRSGMSLGAGHNLLWWVAAVHAIGFGGGMLAATRVAAGYRRGVASGRGAFGWAAAGAALIAWAPMFGALFAPRFGAPAAVAAAVLVAGGSVLVLVLGRPGTTEAEPCAGQTQADPLAPPAP